jgi:dTDP-4-dehydrorhamnose 3,5-epimerase
MSRFLIEDLPIADLKKISRIAYGDNRGYFSRIYCGHEIGLGDLFGKVVQINHSHTISAGTIRGMHYQNSPFTEAKIVTCIRGAIWDVAIDLRKNSPTFLQHHAEVLSEENKCALLIPKGFAHGFQALTDDCDLIYLHDEVFHEGSESGLHYQDTIFNIGWPLPVTEISTRDQTHLFITNEFQGV